MSEKETLIKSIISQLSNLTHKQLQRIHTIIVKYQAKSKWWVNPQSDLIKRDVLYQIGDRLMEHHSGSYENFAKDKLEHLLENVLTENGIPTKRAKNTSRCVV